MVNNQKLPIGISDFKTMRDGEYLYVDKSLLIKELLDASVAVTLLPRPRRFGKTLNLSMMRYFFEKEIPSPEGRWFDTLDKGSHSPRAGSFQGTRPDASRHWPRAMNAREACVSKGAANRHLFDGLANASTTPLSWGCWLHS